MNTKNTTQQFETIIGVDLGDKKHAICVIDKQGEIQKEFFLRNCLNDLTKLARDYPKARVAMEVGTHSPWTSRLLENAGMEVLVANARKLRAIYTNERKCDQLDARMLAKIARMDPELLHPIRHGSEQSQRDLLAIKMRSGLVRSRVAIINSVRGTLKSLGVRLSSPSCTSFPTRARTLLDSEFPELLPAVEPSLQIVEELNSRIKALDKAIAHTAQVQYPQTHKLQQIAGVGPITALSFVLAVEDPDRFKDVRDVGAWLGLVPRRDQSGNTDKQLPISKAGNPQLRTLLVQCAQYLLGHFGPDCDLRRYGLRLASRGGKAAKKKAVIAVARKLAVLMLAMWQDQSDYEPLRIKKRKAA